MIAAALETLADFLSAKGLPGYQAVARLMFWFDA